MVKSFIDYASWILIDKSGYLPITDQNGNLTYRDDLQLLYCYKSNANVFVEFLNVDELTGIQIENKIKNNKNFLIANSNKSIYYFFMVFVSNDKNSEKLELIKSNINNESYKYAPLFICIDLYEKTLTRHFNTPRSSFGLEKALNNIISDEKFMTVEIPDIKEFAKLKSEELKIEFKSKTPIVTYSILAINIAVFALIAAISYFMTKNTVSSNNNFNDLLLINYNRIIGNFSRINQNIVQGQYWRFITPIFIHSDYSNIVHLLSNSFSLYILGPTIEKMIGSKKYILVYLISGIFGNIASFMFSSLDSSSVGASGAIMGLLGALVYFGVENPTQFKRYFGFNVMFIFVINIAFGLSNQNIDNFAHAGGVVGGFFSSAIFGFNTKENKYFNKNRALLITVILAVVGIYYGFYRTTHGL